MGTAWQYQRGQRLSEKRCPSLSRLLQYSINSILVNEHGQNFSDDIFRKAEELAGREFAKNVLNLEQGLDSFIAQLQQALQTLKIGIM